MSNLLNVRDLFWNFFAPSSFQILKFTQKNTQQYTHTIKTVTRESLHSIKLVHSSGNIRKKCKPNYVWINSSLFWKKNSKFRSTLYQVNVEISKISHSQLIDYCTYSTSTTYFWFSILSPALCGISHHFQNFKFYKEVTTTHAML